MLKRLATNKLIGTNRWFPRFNRVIRVYGLFTRLSCVSSHTRHRSWIIVFSFPKAYIRGIFACRPVSFQSDAASLCYRRTIILEPRHTLPPPLLPSLSRNLFGQIKTETLHPIIRRCTAILSRHLYRDSNYFPSLLVGYFLLCFFFFFVNFITFRIFNSTS